MTYYYFTNAAYGLDNLRKKRLKISDIRQLNDPFELVAADISKKENRVALNLLKNETSREKGILCFSRNWRNPVQWSHYADRHRGICLGFEIPTKLLIQVSYVNSRVPWPDVVDQSFLGTLIRTKFAHWSYEDEFRMFCRLREHEDGLFFYSFDNNLRLSKVIVGPESTVTRYEINNAIGDLNTGVEVFKARSAFRSFRVVRQQNERLWP